MACFNFRRTESEYISWWQDSDAEDEDEEDPAEEEVLEKKNCKSESDGYGLCPFSNNLCGIVFVEEK